MGEGPSTQSHEDFPAGHQSEPSAGTHGHEGTDDDDDSSVMHEEDEQPMQE